MSTNRTAAIIVGVLYAIGTGAGILSVVATRPLLSAPDMLASVAAHGDRMILGALLVLTMGLALALVPVVAFPILKRHNEVLALGYLVFRGALEAMTYFVTVVSWLLLAAISRDYADAGTADTTGLRALGAVARGAAEIGAQTAFFVFPMGALMLYAVLYQANLIPRWIAGWGLLAVVPYLAAGVLAIFQLGGPEATAQNLLVLPMLLQELVMAVWLIARGFNPAAVAAAPVPKTAPRVEGGGQRALA